MVSRYGSRVVWSLRARMRKRMLEVVWWEGELSGKDRFRSPGGAEQIAGLSLRFAVCGLTCPRPCRTCLGVGWCLKTR